MTDKPDKCPFCGRPKTNNPNGVVYGCGTMFHGKQPYRSDTCTANEEADELQSQLTALHRALGVFDGDHDRALIRAKHAIADSELLEWAEHQELEISHVDSPHQTWCYTLTFYYPTGDGTLSAKGFHGPDLRDVLRQAMEWEEREQI